MTVSPGELARGNDVQWIDIVDEASLVYYGDAVFAEQDEFWMRNGEAERSRKNWKKKKPLT